MCEKFWELRKDPQVTMAGRGERLRVLWSRFDRRVSSIFEAGAEAKVEAGKKVRTSSVEAGDEADSSSRLS